VTTDTAEWRGQCNLLFAFAGEYLEPSPEHHVMVDELGQFFDQWLEAGKNRPWSRKTLFARLAEHAAERGWDIAKKYTKYPRRTQLAVQAAHGGARGPRHHAHKAQEVLAGVARHPLPGANCGQARGARRGHA
jgi:hypothetical protein